MPEPTRDEYLAALDALLPFPAGPRAEILEEIATHLDDAVADGMSESAAQARLGAPRTLAADLARTAQSTVRLFAGVGAGLRSGVAQWIYGYLLGSLLVLVGSFVLVATVQLTGQVLGTGWLLQFTDQGWNSLLTAVAIAVGLYYAGRAVPESVSLRAHRLADEVRPWATALVSAGLAGLLVFVVGLPLNWASVLGLALAPAAFALGAYRPGLMPRRVRLRYAVLIVVFVTVPLLGLVTATSGGEGGATEVPSGMPYDGGLSIIGPRWAATDDDVGEPAVEGAGWRTSGDGAIAWEARLVDPTALDGLSDLRLEAWHTHPETHAIDPAHDEHFASSSVQRSGAVLSGEIVTTDDPGVGFWTLVVTGRDDGGTRYVVLSVGGGNSTFTGSVWDWLVATWESAR